MAGIWGMNHFVQSGSFESRTKKKTNPVRREAVTDGP